MEKIQELHRIPKFDDKHSAIVFEYLLHFINGKKKHIGKEFNPRLKIYFHFYSTIYHGFDEYGCMSEDIHLLL